MRLIVVRHAEAAPGEPDELRTLTPRGREDAASLGATLAGERLDAIVTSPLLRARETADAIAAAAALAPIVDERLAPGATEDDLRAAAEGRGETVAVVGHQPDLGLAVLAMTGTEHAFPPGGTAVVEL